MLLKTSLFVVGLLLAGNGWPSYVGSDTSGCSKNPHDCRRETAGVEHCQILIRFRSLCWQKKEVCNSPVAAQIARIDPIRHMGLQIVRRCHAAFG